MAPSETGSFRFAPDPDNEGWLWCPATATGRFSDIFGDIRVRIEAADRVRIRVLGEPRHENILGGAHGGFLMALIDQVYFIAPGTLGMSGVIHGVTLDSMTQFLGPVAIGRPIDAVVEVLRETGRLIFLRGLIEQDGRRAVAFSGTLRKSSTA